MNSEQLRSKVLDDIISKLLSVNFYYSVYTPYTVPCRTMPSGVCGIWCLPHDVVNSNILVYFLNPMMPIQTRFDYRVTAAFSPKDSYHGPMPRRCSLVTMSNKVGQI